MQTEIRLRESQGRKGGVSLKKTELIEAIAERADVPKSQAQEFEGQRAQLLNHIRYYEAGMATDVLVLDAVEGDPRTRLELHGCFNGDDEFVEVRRVL